MKINFPILDEPIEISGGTILAVENVTVFSNLVRQKIEIIERVRVTFSDRYFRI